MAPFTSLADVGQVPGDSSASSNTEQGRRGIGKKKFSTADDGRSRAHSKAGSVVDDGAAVLGMRGSLIQRKGTGLPFCDAKTLKKQKGPTLMFQAMTTPGKMRLRELDPRRVAFQESASTRVVLDWRKNRWEGTNRLIERLLPTPRLVQYSMKLEGAARASQVPEDNCELSSEEDVASESSDDAIVNSDEEPSTSSKYTSSNANGSTAADSCTMGSRVGGSSSGLTRDGVHIMKRRNKVKQRITGWLSQYSGCTKGHGERLMRKIYKPRAEDINVKMNSGVRELLMTTPPCFCSLQAVNFRNFLIGNRGVQALWPLLRYARALKSLNLSGNDIHDSGMQHILQVLEADVQGSGKDDVGGLLVVDLSRNPITGSVFTDLMRFNDARADVLMLGLADTMMPMVKRQRILRQSLTKFAGVEPHLMLEAWRLAKDPLDFVDRELFIQCERIVEATHGSAIHDMTDISHKAGRRHVGWQEDDDDWDDYEPPEGDDTFEGQDGFLGLDDLPEEHFDDGSSSVAQAASDSARETPSELLSPTPPPPKMNPFQQKANQSTSWAMRRRLSATQSPPDRMTTPRSDSKKPNGSFDRDDRRTVFEKRGNGKPVDL